MKWRSKYQFDVGKRVWRLWHRHKGWMSGLELHWNKLLPQTVGLFCWAYHPVERAQKASSLQASRSWRVPPPRLSNQISYLGSPSRGRRKQWGKKPEVFLHGYLFTLKKEEWEISILTLATLSGHCYQPSRRMMCCNERLTGLETGRRHHKILSGCCVLLILPLTLLPSWASALH